MELTRKQKATIADNLAAFVHNFGEPRIERNPPYPGFYVYMPAGSKDYVHYCYDISYLDGWLYGAVQAKHNRFAADDNHS